MSSTGGAQRRLLVVMGVAGAGKTRIGTELARRLALEYGDADAFHPPANVVKMASGHALDEADRAPWLDAIGAWLYARRAVGAVVSCSALRRSYRDRLRARVPELSFVHLAADVEVIRERVAARPDHFMPVSLVESQFAILEPLAADERGVTVDARLPPPQIVEDLLARV